MTRHIPDAEFERRGYSRFDPRGTHYANRAFQKRFRDDGGTTLYFLNFYQYEFPASTTCEASLYPPDRENEWVTLGLHYCGDLDYAEKFFADVYTKLGMIPDKHNND